MSQSEVNTSDSCCSQPCGGSIQQNGPWLKISLALVILTILYNVAEAVLAVWFGEQAESIALIGFGFDSIIEVSAAAIVLWRLTIQMRSRDEDVVERAEKAVHRYVGVTFFLLAVYILFEAGLSLWSQSPPHATVPGVIIALLSLIVMPLLAAWKMKAAGKIGSNALHAEAKETIACSILSLILLVGLTANAFLDWWWADPVAALVMIPWLVKEGLAGLRGEGCCG